MRSIYYFFSSFFFFLWHLFYKKSYKVIFYSPTHFNRGKNNSNIYLEPLFDICNRNNISYLYLEEPSYNLSYKRSINAIPCDFIFILVILLRKLMFSTEMSIIQKDKKIGKFLHKTFFKGLSFSNYITVSQSFLSVFRGINNQATLFDVQHGIIYSKKSSYINNNHPSENIFNNDVKLLLNGDMYKNILKNSDVTNYYSENSFSLGYSLMPFLKKSHSLNKNVVVSLQFTDDHTQEENKKMFILLESFVSQHQDFTFYLRSHHRTNNDIYLNKLITYDHVLLSTQDLFDDLESCSFHVTFYSTTTFDAGLCGIPTYFLNSKHIDLFYEEFHYPFNKDVSLLELFNNYSVFSSEIQKWSSLYYKNIDETLFLSLLKT